MITFLRRRGALVAGVALVFTTGGVALAAAPALPLKNKVYDRAGTLGAKQVELTLIVSKTRATRLVSGPLTPPLGSQYAVSAGALPCPKAPRTSTLAKSEDPFALFGFPGATLRLKDGHYSFSVKRTDPAQHVFGSSATKTFRLTVTLKGTVVNSRTIEGTLSAVGGSCTTRKPVAWKLTLNRKLQPPPH